MCVAVQVGRSSQIPKYEAQRFKNAVQRYYKFFICANKNGDFGWWIGTFGNFCTLFGEKDTIEETSKWTMDNGKWKMIEENLEMDNGKWKMIEENLEMDNGKWKIGRPPEQGEAGWHRAQ